ncbi:hypothetical protein OG625_32755 [Streptomyces sp. NBC_01351]|uniref:hypothetical protein n=1 Tax=Streptomyces sp. NBC_01351 TaxID=2903833 RepID=UPI002E354586|nr:hypothetical protein [Streptomyces sp. NBC_01351]
MWPGQQQPPGGEQNPQGAQQNPYQQQPGQPNPYQQQPGYGYPQQPGYQQPPTVPGQQWGPPQQPAQPQGGGGSPYQTKTVAIVSAAAVIVAAAATGAYVFTRDDNKTNQADDKPAASVSAPATTEPAPAGSSPNPRAGGEVKPVVPGWKVVVNPKYGTAFDVPPEWNVLGAGMSIGFEDKIKNDGSPFVMMSAPAVLKENWCKVDADKDGDEETYDLAGTGTKGGQGAKDTAEAVRNAAGSWVLGAYAQKAPKESVKVSEAKEYTTSSGLKGHMATATASNLAKDHKCSSDGKSIAFSFKTTNGDFSSWILHSAAGVPDEVKQETMDKVLSTVRLTTS